MAWGAAAGAAMGAGNNALSTGLQYGLNKKLMTQQHKFAERMARHTYRYAVEDLLGAGLNPILAVGGQAPAPSGVGASVANPDLGGGAIAMMKAGQELKNLKQQHSMMDSQMTLMQAQSSHASAQAGLAHVKKLIALNEELPMAEAMKKLFDTPASKDGGINVGDLARWLNLFRAIWK